MISVPSKTQKLFLECASVPVLGVVNWSNFILDYSLQLDIIICLNVSMENMLMLCVACPCSLSSFNS